MPFNIYLDDKLVQENAFSPQPLTGLLPAKEYKLSVTEIVNGKESNKWNGKLITKQIVEGEMISFLQNDYKIIEGDTFFLEPIVMPWNTTGRDKIKTVIEGDETVLRREGDNSFTALKVGSVIALGELEFESGNVTRMMANVEVLPQSTEPKYPTVFGLGSFNVSSGAYENKLTIAKWDTDNTHFSCRGDHNEHDWTIDISEGKDVVKIINGGRRVQALKTGIAKGKLYYVSNPTVTVDIEFEVIDSPVDFIFDRPLVKEPIGAKGKIVMTYIPQNTSSDEELNLNVMDSDIVSITQDEVQRNVLNYEILGKGTTQVYVHRSNATRIITFTGI